MPGELPGRWGSASRRCKRHQLTTPTHREEPTTTNHSNNNYMCEMTPSNRKLKLSAVSPLFLQGQNDQDRALATRKSRKAPIRAELRSSEG